MICLPDYYTTDYLDYILKDLKQFEVGFKHYNDLRTNFYKSYFLPEFDTWEEGTRLKALVYERALSSGVDLHKAFSIGVSPKRINSSTKFKLCMILNLFKEKIEPVTFTDPNSSPAISNTYSIESLNGKFLWMDLVMFDVIELEDGVLTLKAKI